MSDRDQLRDELTEVLWQEPFAVAPQDARRWVDAILPILHAAVEQARADTAEQIAQAIEAERDSHGRGAFVKQGLTRAAGIARQHGRQP